MDQNTQSNNKNPDQLNLPASFGNIIQNDDEDNNLNKPVSPNDVNFHRHTGTDSPKLNPKDFLGWPIILVADATVKPKDSAQEGVFRFYRDTVPVYRLWARINKDWHYLTLT